MSSEKMDTTFYVRIKANRGQAWAGARVISTTAVKLTQSAPALLSKDEVVVKLTVRLPAEAFDALTPEAVVVVPAELIQRATEVEAEAGDASQ